MFCIKKLIFNAKAQRCREINFAVSAPLRYNKKLPKRRALSAAEMQIFNAKAQRSRAE
jgi:hypothetical protein